MTDATPPDPLTDAWLSECWPTCPELPRGVREQERIRAAARDAALAERYGDDGRQIGAA